MLITKTENNLVHTYSDAGFTVIQDGTGVEYYEAWDPINSGRTYTESTNPRDLPPEHDDDHDPDADNDAVTDQDKALIKAARIMLGTDNDQDADGGE